MKLKFCSKKFASKSETEDVSNFMSAEFHSN